MGLLAAYFSAVLLMEIAAIIFALQPVHLFGKVCLLDSILYGLIWIKLINSLIVFDVLTGIKINHGEKMLLVLLLLCYYYLLELRFIVIALNNWSDICAHTSNIDQNDVGEDLTELWKSEMELNKELFRELRIFSISSYAASDHKTLWTMSPKTGHWEGLITMTPRSLQETGRTTLCRRVQSLAVGKSVWAKLEGNWDWAKH